MIGWNGVQPFHPIFSFSASFSLTVCFFDSDTVERFGLRFGVARRIIKDYTVVFLIQAAILVFFIGRS